MKYLLHETFISIVFPSVLWDMCTVRVSGSSQALQAFVRRGTHFPEMSTRSLKSLRNVCFEEKTRPSSADTTTLD